MEATAYLCATVTCPHPRDPVVTNREGIILIIAARRHCHYLHIGSWELPLVSKHHCGLVWLEFFYSIDWTRDPWVRVNCKMRQEFETFKKFSIPLTKIIYTPRHLKSKCYNNIKNWLLVTTSGCFLGTQVWLPHSWQTFHMGNEIPKLLEYSINRDLSIDQNA